MADCINQLSFSLSNKLGFFPKLEKNKVIFVVSDIFSFRANYTINKSTTKFLCGVFT